MKSQKPYKLCFRAISTAIAAAALALTSGCFLVAIGVGGAVGAGTVAYVRGELDSALSNDYDQVVEATHRAVAQLEYIPVRETKDGSSTDIVAHTADDKKVEIKLIRSGDKLTQVEIRIGLFGDEVRSRQILEKIKADL
jgi:hypothetical protein